MAKITFLGATQTVTGSKYLIEAGGKRLLVDCGLFEGSKPLRLRNWDRLPIDTATFDCVLLTHAHIDHTGYLPRLCRDGFRGPIYANPATHELCNYLLPDSAHLQEEDAKYAQKKGSSKHKPPLPLYTVVEAQEVLTHFREIPRSDPFTISPQFSVHPFSSGHILGAASLELTITENGKSCVVVFSGDIGRYGDPILKDPQTPPRADFILCETTYGDRDHPADKNYDSLADAVTRTAKRGGTVVIPAFSVGRTQLLIYILHKLEEWQRIPNLPIYLDSPMSINVSDLYAHHPEDFNAEFSKEAQQGDPLDMRDVRETRTVEESKQINDVKTPCVILSASGMATGGRILHHLAQRLPDSRNSVLLAGFQAEGTRGRAMLEHASTIRIFGEDIPVRAEIVDLPEFSAHGDRNELARWLSGFSEPPKQLFLVHGELAAMQAFQSRIASRYRCPITLPKYGDSFTLIP